MAAEEEHSASPDFKEKQSEDPAQAKAGSAAAVPECINDDFQVSDGPACPMTPAMPEPGLIHPQSTKDPERRPENRQLKTPCRNQLSDAAQRPKFVTEKRKGDDVVVLWMWKKYISYAL